MEELQAKFFRVYANLPLAVRDNVAVVVDNQPITWSVAYLEIKANSPKAGQILHELNDLDLI